MLTVIFGNQSAERVLLYLESFQRAYARQIATKFDCPVSMIQNQLRRMERDNLLESVKFGNLRIYSFNRRYPLLPELRKLLRSRLDLMERSEYERLFVERRRPRKQGKPLVPYRD